MKTRDSFSDSNDNRLTWESTMREASDQLQVQPEVKSWVVLSSKLDQHKKEGGGAVIPFFGKYILRIAAVLLIGVGIWWTVAKQNQPEPLMSEWITDSPAYFASYLDVAQSLEGQAIFVEGGGNVEFRQGYTGLQSTEDTIGKL